MEENQDGHWLKNQEEEIMMIVGKCKYAPNVEDHSYNFLKSVDIYLKKSSVRLDSTESGVHILRFSFFFFFSPTRELPHMGSLCRGQKLLFTHCLSLFTTLFMH